MGRTLHRAFARSMILPEQHPELQLLLERYLSARWGEQVQVSAITRFHGGAARETYRFVCLRASGPLALVVRRDPQSSLIRTSRQAEYHILGRAFQAGLPVPQPLFLETEPFAFQTPGFIMTEVPGGRAAGLFDQNPYGDNRARTGTSLYTALGKLHALKPDETDRQTLPFHDAASRLRHWKSEIQAHALRPEPVVTAAIRWLERNVPEPSGPASLVHGDFRSGNFLVDESSGLLAILDWEMAHIGDPMEDLAWSMDPLWSHSEPELAAATLPREEAIAAWEASSGRRFAAQSWPWWQLFAGVSGLAIWITSSFEVANHKTVDPVMTFAGFYPYRFHNAQVAMLLERVAG